MKMSLFKKFFFITLISIVDHNLMSLLSKVYVFLPLTFLCFSFYVYKSKDNITAYEAFLIGIYVDFLSNSYLGFNVILFCTIAYLINLYANSFKLFSYLQICIFFGISSSAYVGFSQLIINIYNFSYLTLFISTLFNLFFCFLLALISAYFPNTFVKRFRI